MKPVRQCVTVFLALAILGAAQPLLRIDSTDPARDLAPVRLFVSTRAGAVDITVANAWVASYGSSIVSGREGVRSSRRGRRYASPGTSQRSWQKRSSTSSCPTCRSPERSAGGSAPGVRPRPFSTCRCRAVQAHRNPSTASPLTKPLPHLRPMPLCSSRDRFAWRARRRDSCWRSSIPVPNLAAWNDSDLAGRPLRRCSTDDLADVTRLAREARSAGIDAFDMSWQGPSDRRLDTILTPPRRRESRHAPSSNRGTPTSRI